MLTVVILTYNEALHIERALASVQSFSDRCFVIDSGSTDNTVQLAKAAGAEVLIHPFVTQSQQFNWALEQLPDDTDWVFRLDADEIVTRELAASIARSLPTFREDIDGIYVSRRMSFLGKRIHWGGVFPIKILRIFRSGRGRCENRWMDEHIVVSGNTINLTGEIIDDNLNSLGWWISKHNAYSSREVVDILNHKYGFMSCASGHSPESNHHASTKRWIKENIYARLPGGSRALAYFVYRYIIRLGFLDGKAGAAFHILQGFWYRYLVDMKLYEVEQYMRKHDADVRTAVSQVLEIDLDALDVIPPSAPQS